jgi:aminoglycoside 6'-N-acetyltransferase I
MDTIVVEINKNNIQNAAELSIELWPHSSLAEMTAHYEGVLNASLATCFLLQNESGYFGFIELSVRNDYVEGAEELPVAYIEGLFVNPMGEMRVATGSLKCNPSNGAPDATRVP